MLRSISCIVTYDTFPSGSALPSYEIGRRGRRQNNCVTRSHSSQTTYFHIYFLVDVAIRSRSKGRNKTLLHKVYVSLRFVHSLLKRLCTVMVILPHPHSGSALPPFLPMNDTAPTLVAADIAVHVVHDFQHTEIMLRDEARPGQQFVRPLPSKCFIHFEEDEVHIPVVVRDLAGLGQALDTEALHCACAVHAVFGVPSASGKLAAPRARQLAVSLLSQASPKARSSQDVRR